MQMAETRARLKVGSFEDAYRGNGVFASVPFRAGYLLIALRWRWHLYTIAAPIKKVRRIYVGPIEIEFPSPGGEANG